MTDILEQFDNLEQAERDLLSKLSNKLTRAFQVIYEVDGTVDWERIYRLSPDSNFIMVTGIAHVPKGTPMGDGQPADKELELIVSFTLPLDIIEDGTPYQIADSAKSLGIIRQIMGPELFVTALRGKDTTMETLKAYLPSAENYDIMKKHKQETPNNKKQNGLSGPYKSFIEEFDTDSLTDEQLKSLQLNSWSNTK